MPEKNELDGEVRELETKDADDATKQLSDEEILALIKTHQELQRYIDRKVTDGIKTFAANQKKKAAKTEDDPQVGESRDLEGGKIQESESKKEDSNQMAEPGAEPADGSDIKKELSKRGLASFAGMVESIDQIDALELAIAEFLRTQNLGADFAPGKTADSSPELSPLEAYIAQRLGIGAKGYASRKKELNK